MTWLHGTSAPKDGSRILVRDKSDPTYFWIVWWTNDVYAEQGGKGGQAGWFAGEYSDRWGDYPVMEKFDEWMEIDE